MGQDIHQQFKLGSKVNIFRPSGSCVLKTAIHSSKTTYTTDITFHACVNDVTSLRGKTLKAFILSLVSTLKKNHVAK